MLERKEHDTQEDIEQWSIGSQLSQFMERGEGPRGEEWLTFPSPISRRSSFLIWIVRPAAAWHVCMLLRAR